MYTRSTSGSYQILYDGDTIRRESDAKAYFYNDTCDKYDYMAAAGCGAIAGLIDIFLVGSPADSVLQPWTDAQVDQAVMFFARRCKWKPKPGQEQNVASAIGFLERNFRVNYDQRRSADVQGLFSMGTTNHHMKSLAHAPDPIGLFFSILNQFTGTSSFLSDGRLITIRTDTQELQGHNLISCLFCGIANWFGHIMSDVAGSSGAQGRGSGVVIPFYELFQCFPVGSFQNGQYRNTLATLATKVFQEGYDLRFGLTMAIPVLVCNLSIKLIWALRHHFYYKRPLNECIPSKRHNDLRVMLLLGNGTLCLMDAADAGLRSGGNMVAFFLRLNLIAWVKFTSLVLREVCIRLGIRFPLQKQLDAYIRINEALTAYLAELKQLDTERFRQETEQYNQLVLILESAESEADLTHLLKEQYKTLGFPSPWGEGDFDTFMQQKEKPLVFC